jgi:hypothetical protein
MSSRMAKPGRYLHSHERKTKLDGLAAGTGAAVVARNHHPDLLTDAAVVGADLLSYTVRAKQLVQPLLPYGRNHKSAGAGED